MESIGTPSTSVWAKMIKIKPQNKNLCFNSTNVERFLDSYKMAAEVDSASKYDMAYRLQLFISSDEVMEVIESFDGFESHDWVLLEEAMIAYWGKIDIARFTLQDLDALVSQWTSNGGISSASDYQAFRKSWDPIQSYLIQNNHIDTVDKI